MAKKAFKPHYKCIYTTESDDKVIITVVNGIVHLALEVSGSGLVMEMPDALVRDVSKQLGDALNFAEDQRHG